jgi:hypothetical protein
MNRSIVMKANVALLLLGSLLGASAMAEVHVSAGLVFDNRHGHNHYYPAVGAVVHTMPRDAYVTRYRGTPYYFRGGVWYRHARPGYVVARPPVGTVIRVLPAFYTTLWFGGIPYYYADYVYYRWDVGSQAYVVSDPPNGEPDREDNDNQPAASRNTDLFVYPKNGQSDEQRDTDRYECHRWAADQTGFDPTKSQGGVEADQVNSKRVDYRRAETACLEGRGYTVK